MYKIWISTQYQRIIIFLRIMHCILAHSYFTCLNPYLKKNTPASDVYSLTIQPREKTVFLRYAYYYKGLKGLVCETEFFEEPKYVGKEAIFFFSFASKF